MKTLLLVTSLVGSLTVLWAIVVASSPPAGYFDRIEAGFSDDRQRAFYYNRDQRELWLYDLERGELGEPITLELKSLKWAADDQKLLGIASDHTASRHRFAIIDPRTGELALEAFASHFSQGQADPESILLFGRGNYLDDHQLRSVHPFSLRDRDPPEPTPARVLPDGFPVHGHYTLAKQSPDGTLLAVSMWSHREADRFSLIRLSDWREIVSAEHEASFAFFLPDKRQLIAVKATGARLQLHRYQIDQGDLLASSAERSGSSDVARLSPDGRYLALAVIDSDPDPHLDLISTADLAVHRSIPFPGARNVLDLAFDEDGKRIRAIGESGNIWEVNLASGETSITHRLFPKKFDRRWIPPAIGLAIYGLLWIPLIRHRRRSRADTSLSPLFRLGGFWILGGILFEAAYLTLNLSVAISAAGVLLALAHLVAAGTAILFLLSAALMKWCGNYWVGVALTATVSTGAWIGATMIFAAIASV